MKISYDLAALPERRRGLKESEEVTAIKAFLAGTQKNMCFDLYRNDKCIYILRIKNGTPKGKKNAAPDAANIKDGE